MPEHIDSYSREVQEVMEQPSKWYINVGCTIIMILLLLGILALIKVRLPEVINGKATIYKAASAGQPGDNVYAGILRVNELDLNAIRKGMKVNLDLAGYPAYKYGTLTGTITDLPDSVNLDHTLSLKFSLAGELKTTRNFTPLLLNGMNANVQIPVGNSNFFYKILKL